MTDKESNTAGQSPTYKERFAEACKVADFATATKAVSGYIVWEVQHVRDGQRVTIAGPFFTEDEARITADLLRGTFRGARAYDSTHLPTWNPDPLREKAIREEAMASRMMLAAQLGTELPTQTVATK